MTRHRPILLGILALVALAVGAPTASDAASYAAGVKAAKLSQVADLETSPPGPRPTPAKIPGRDPWPACVTPNSPAPRQLTIDPTRCGSVKLQGWILHGWDIRVVGKGEVQILDVDWTPKPGSKSYMLGVGYFDGVFSGAPSVSVERSTVDGSQQGINGVFAILGSGELALRGDRIKNFGPGVVITTGEHNDQRRRNLVLTGNWMGPIGMNSFNGVAADPAKYWNMSADHDNPGLPGGAHAEFIKFNYGSTINVSGNLFDLFGNPGDRGASFNAFISVLGFEGRVTGPITGNIFRWNRGQQWTKTYVPRTVSSAIFLYSTPADGHWSGYSYDVTISGNVMQKGWSTHVTRDDRPGAPASRLINGGGNVDYETGAALRF